MSVCQSPTSHHVVYQVGFHGPTVLLYIDSVTPVRRPLIVTAAVTIGFVILGD